MKKMLKILNNCQRRLTMLKIIRRTQEQQDEKSVALPVVMWMKVTNRALAARAGARVKKHVQQRYPLIHLGIVHQMHQGMDNDGNITHGALLYALKHDLYQEAKDLLRIASLTDVCEFLTGKYSGNAKPEILDELCLLLSLKEAKQIMETNSEMLLPKTKAWLEKVKLDVALPIRLGVEQAESTAVNSTNKAKVHL